MRDDAQDAGDEVAAQYMIARAELPDADEFDLIEVIMSRLGEETLLELAADYLLVEGEPTGNRRDMAKQYVHNFVFEMESDPEDDPE